MNKRHNNVIPITKAEHILLDEREEIEGLIGRIKHHQEKLKLPYSEIETFISSLSKEIGQIDSSLREYKKMKDEYSLSTIKRPIQKPSILLDNITTMTTLNNSELMTTSQILSAPKVTIDTLRKVLLQRYEDTIDKLTIDASRNNERKTSITIDKRDSDMLDDIKNLISMKKLSYTIIDHTNNGDDIPTPTTESLESLTKDIITISLSW